MYFHAHILNQFALIDKLSLYFLKEILLFSFKCKKKLLSFTRYNFKAVLKKVSGIRYFTIYYSDLEKSVYNV